MSRANFLCLLLFVSVRSVSAQGTVRPGVDAIFAEYDRRDSPGCALGVIQQGRLIYGRGYGMANLEYGIPITTRSVFRIGSTSKQFTAMSVTLLAERGKLSLDDDVRKHFPELPRYDRVVTIRHLIHHTSGIRDYLTLARLAGLRGDDFYTDRQVVDLLARQMETNFPPGDEFLYSNSNYFLMALLVERVTGVSLREFAQEEIFEPLTMQNTHFHNDHRMIVPGRASGYRERRQGGFEIHMTTLDMIGDGGVFTTVEDLVAWDRNFYHPRIGSSRLLETMHQVGRLYDGSAIDYAFGLRIGTYRGLQTVRHGGSFVGFRAELLRFPEQEFSVICLCNLARTNPSRLADRVADVFLEDHFTEAKLAGPGPKPPLRSQALEIPLAQVEGEFISEDGSAWTLKASDEGITARAGSGRELLLVATGPTELTATGTENPVQIRLGQVLDGELMSMEVVRAGRGQAFRRADWRSPSSEELSRYVGTYFSRELQVSYQIELEEGKLRMRHTNAFRRSPEEPLTPWVRGWFTTEGLLLRFSLESGRQPAFDLNAGRVRNIRFVLRP